MGFRFRRRIRVFPGLTLNLGKQGVSASVGVRGAHVTVGPTGTRTTVGLPGTGLSYTRLEKPAGHAAEAPSEPDDTEPKRPGSAARGFILIAILIAIAVMIVVAAGCNAKNPAGSVQPKPPSPEPPARARIAPSSASKELAYMVIGLITDSRNRPATNAVDTYVAAFHWKKAPADMNALLNAKVAYYGKIGAQKVLLGGDGTNDIFGASVMEGFQPDVAFAEFASVYTLNKQDSEDSDGQRYDSYILIDHGAELGLLTITYGLADAIRGAGTIGFVGVDRLRKELAKGKRAEGER